MRYSFIVPSGSSTVECRGEQQVWTQEEAELRWGSHHSLQQSHEIYVARLALPYSPRAS